MKRFHFLRQRKRLNMGYVIPRSWSILQVLQDAKNALHYQRSLFPCGIRSIDDGTDQRIQSITSFIRDLESRIK